MKALDKSREALELWQAVIPFCPPPQTRQFILWTARFPDDLMERAFMRASRRFSPDREHQLLAELVHKYVTGVLLNLEKEVKRTDEHEPRTHSYQRSK